MWSHGIKGLNDVMRRSPSRYVTTFPRLAAISTTEAANGDVLSFLIKLQVQTPRSCFWHYGKRYKTTWSKSHATYWVGAPQFKSPPCKVCWPLALWWCIYKALSLSCDPVRPRGQRVKWLYRYEPLKVSYHSAMFRGHWHYGSDNLKLMICLVIPQDHVITSVMRFYEWEPFMVSHHPAKFGGHRHCGKGDLVFSDWKARFHMLAEICHYYLSLKHMACHALIHKSLERRHSYLICHVNESDIGHTRLEQE